MQDNLRRNTARRILTKLINIKDRKIIKSNEGNNSILLEDSRGVRHGDHLPAHKYIKNTSACGTTPTEHLLNSDRRPRASKNASQSPRNGRLEIRLGKKKKEKGTEMGAVKE